MGGVYEYSELVYFSRRVTMNEDGYRRRVIGETCERKDREWTRRDGEGESELDNVLQL